MSGDADGEVRRPRGPPATREVAEYAGIREECQGPYRVLFSPDDTPGVFRD
jgi:hypothetical protein